jgi:hypothetical protein
MNTGGGLFGEYPWGGVERAHRTKPLPSGRRPSARGAVRPRGCSKPRCGAEFDPAGGRCIVKALSVNAHTVNAWAVNVECPTVRRVRCVVGVAAHAARGGGERLMRSPCARE